MTLLIAGLVIAVMGALLAFTNDSPELMEEWARDEATHYFAQADLPPERRDSEYRNATTEGILARAEHHRRRARRFAAIRAASIIAGRILLLVAAVLLATGLGETIIAAPWEALTAYATAVAAALVAVQIGRETWRERVRRRTVNARISTIAYQLRRQIRSWVGDAVKANTSTPGDDFDKWIRKTMAMKTLGQHLDRAEERLAELMALRPDAWRHRGLALDRAYVLFLEGTRHLNEYASVPEPSGAMASYNWGRLRIDSLKELRQCITTLERGVISPTVLTAERDLAAQLEAEDPLTQAVDATFSEGEDP